MLHVLQVHLQRGVAYETNVLHVWIQFHGALRARNAHITVYDVTTWNWVNLVHPFHTQPLYSSLGLAVSHHAAVNCVF